LEDTVRNGSLNKDIIIKMSIGKGHRNVGLRRSKSTKS
jgi:hypothetical protein